MDFQEYFQSYDNYFWEWENEILTAESVFETLVIPEGSTIAYEQFVMETLNLLSLDGFPPFGAFLLALIATNANGEEGIEKVFAIINSSSTLKKQKEYPKAFTYARNFLHTLSGLPNEFKQGDKRKEVLQFIFRKCHNRLSSDRAKTIMQHYNNQKHLLVSCAKKLPFSAANLNKDFNVLAHLNIKYPTSAYLMEAMTGMPALPVLYDETLEQRPVAVSSGNFVDELIDDPKTFPVGSLIHRIWGGLNIPLHHSAPSHQPLGGISDLTNKGDFDKLLISEFANDDVLFMSRLANNEALYIKREVPPESEKFVRLLLIDCSLKNWGTPKILAFASALAIARHPKTDIECKIIIMGNGCNEAACETVTDVIDAMSNLGNKLDAASELQEVLNENTDVKHSEVFLITSEDALSSAGMQLALSDNHDKIKYIITAETEGNLNFYRMQNRGRKLMQHIYLPLDELWAKKANNSNVKQPKNVAYKGDTVPDEIYPILSTLPKKRMETFILNKTEYYILTNNGMLFKVNEKPKGADNYYKAHKGSELLLHNLSVKPGGRYALQLNEDGEFILAAFYRKEMLITMLNLQTREFHKKKISLKGNADDYVLFEDNNFYLFDINVRECYRIMIHKGELHINDISLNNNIEKDYHDYITKIDLFINSISNHDVVLNLMPLCITKEKTLQFNRHNLDINLRHSNYNSIDLVARRKFIPDIEAVYEKINKRFRFPDGSAIYRDSIGMLILKSSNADIPTIYMPTTMNLQLAMATQEAFTGNNSFFKGNPGQKIIPIAEFNTKYLQPFINTIVNHGT